MSTREARQFPVSLVWGYRLWQAFPRVRGASPAPLPIRLTVESVLALSPEAWGNAYEHNLVWTLRELRERLYPDGSYPKTKRLVQSLRQVKNLWDKWPRSDDWLESPEQWIVWRVLSLDLSNLGGDRTCLDGQIELRVTAARGDRFLPTPALAGWGARSSPAFNLLLLCAAAWSQGIEVHESEIGEYCHPVSLTRNRPQLRSRGRRVLAMLVEAGLLTVNDGFLKRGSAHYGTVEAGSLPKITVPEDSKPREPKHQPMNDPRLAMKMARDFHGKAWDRYRIPTV